MGTSTSSSGAGAGVSFDPPWLNDIESNINTNYIDLILAPSSNLATSQEILNTVEQISTSIDVNIPTPQFAPQSRYKTARSALTAFVQSGSDSDLKRGLASFIKKGMGGSKRASHRLQTTAVAASALGGLLAVSREGTDSEINTWVASIKERDLSARDVALEVVNKLIPLGGSIDEESAKYAISEAVINLYEEYSNVDIFNLSDDQIASVMAYTIAMDVYNHAQLELGRCFEKLRYSSKVIQNRLGKAFNFIKAIVNQSMDKVLTGSIRMTMREIANSALETTLAVFEEL